MASDTAPGQGEGFTPGTNMSVSLSGDEESLRRYWEGLHEGATVTMALEKQMWGDEFGMLPTVSASRGWSTSGPRRRSRRTQPKPETAASSSSSASPVCTARRWRCGSASRSPTKPTSRLPRTSVR